MGLKFSCLKGKFWGGYRGFLVLFWGGWFFSCSVKASGGWLYIEEL